MHAHMFIALYPILLCLKAKPTNTERIDPETI
jgi:hypothetical protein